LGTPWKQHDVRFVLGEIPSLVPLAEVGFDLAGTQRNKMCILSSVEELNNYHKKDVVVIEGWFGDERAAVCCVLVV
jgi:hypothetical protein